MTMARWQGTVTDDAGNVVPNANVEVRRETPGAPLATLYADRQGTVALGNPFITDSEGFAAFHVIGGSYQVRAYKNGFERVWRYVGVGTGQEADLVALYDPGLLFEFETQTAAPPSVGAIRANNANLAAATQLFVSKTNRGGSNMVARLLELAPNGKSQRNVVILTNPQDGPQATWQITSAAETGTHVVLGLTAHTGETSFPVGSVGLQRELTGTDGVSGTIASVAATSLPAGSNPTVANNGTPSTAQLVFGIPAGTPGDTHLAKARVANTASMDFMANVRAGMTLDGVVLAAGNVVLIKGQSDASQNGLYVVQTGAAPTRHPSYQTNDSLAGILVSVLEGTLNANSVWVSTGDLTGGTAASTGRGFIRIPTNSRALEVIPDDFGAKGDGTTNDTGAFTAASLVADSIYVPQGTYVITSYASISAFIHKLHGPGLLKIGSVTIPAGDITTDLTLSVPSTFATINDVLSYLAARRVTRVARIITVKLADGTYNPASLITLYHPDSPAMIIEGNNAAPQNVIVNIGTHDGFDAKAGIFTLRGLTIRGTSWTSHGVWTGINTGVRASRAGNIRVDNCRIDRCYFGVTAVEGGSIEAVNSVVTEAGDAGFFAFVGGHLTATGCRAENCLENNSIVSFLGYGFGCEGGSIWLNNCVSTNNGNAQGGGGVAVNIGGLARIDGGDFRSNLNLGMLVANGSVVEVNNALFNFNVNGCAKVENGAQLTAFSCQFNGSTAGFGVWGAGGAMISLYNSMTAENNTHGWLMGLGSTGKANGGHTSYGNPSGDYSPAFGTVGNQNSIIAN